MYFFHVLLIKLMINYSFSYQRELFMNEWVYCRRLLSLGFPEHLMIASREVILQLANNLFFSSVVWHNKDCLLPQMVFGSIIWSSLLHWFALWCNHLHLNYVIGPVCCFPQSPHDDTCLFRCTQFQWEQHIVLSILSTWGKA